MAERPQDDRKSNNYGARTMTPEDADRQQQWAGMDGATAWSLIDRHANDWNEINEMMNAWLRANGGGKPSDAE